ncbi:MAG: carbohydrate ABC transporter permease [Ruminococcaceae bacterium]|nr:carbohydrate ABC transporter permease [Oscillospiraceae bacterium]
MKIKESLSWRIFNVFNICFMLLLCFIMIYPFWYVICASFSNGDLLLGHSKALFAPIGFTTDAYIGIFKNPMIMQGYINTLIIVVGGVAVNMIITTMGAYTLSRKDVYWNKLIMKLVTITMFFNGGLIPSYLLISRTLGLNNSFLAVILPLAVSTYNLIVLKTSFSQVPESLVESALLEGAGHFRVMAQVVVPLSKSILAVILLYYTVDRWNSWFNASIYLKDRALYPLQLILREILIQNDVGAMSDPTATDQYALSETIKYATIVVATVPILIVYPFVQKFFTKGVMIGAVKE